MNRSKQLETMLAIVTGLLVIYALSDNRWVLKSAIVIGLIGLLIPSLSGWITIGWLKLSEAIGYVMSRVLMSVVFFVFLFPIAKLSTLFGRKDTLQLRRSKEASYYTTRNQTYTAEHLENPW